MRRFYVTHVSHRIVFWIYSFLKRNVFSKNSSSMKFTCSVYPNIYIQMFHMFCTCPVLSFMEEKLYNKANVNNGEWETYRTSPSYSLIPLLLQILAIKYWQKTNLHSWATKCCWDVRDGRAVGHLSREVSRICKFLLDRGTSITAELTSTKYRRSPLVKGGPEIPCKINVKRLSSVKNVKLLNKFEKLLADLYIEPESPQILGPVLQDNIIYKEGEVEPRQKI